MAIYFSTQASFYEHLETQISDSQEAMPWEGVMTVRHILSSYIIIQDSRKHRIGLAFWCQVIQMIQDLASTLSNLARSFPCWNSKYLKCFFHHSRSIHPCSVISSITLTKSLRKVGQGRSTNRMMREREREREAKESPRLMAVENLDRKSVV